MTSFKTGLAIAANAALLAAAVAAMPSAAQAMGNKATELVHCYGVNTCNGTSDCKAGSHECKGQNACKGQGFKALTAEQCAAQGGTLTEQK